jgi:hypothetical protein
MEGLRELSDVLNGREIYLEDFETCPSSSKCFLENLGQVSKQISLQFKTSLNSLRPSISEL